MSARAFGEGLGTGADPVAAAADAFGQATRDLGGPPDLVVAFVSCGPSGNPDAAAAAVSEGARRTGAGTVVATSAHGVIGAGRGLEQTSAVAVFAARLPGVSLRPFRLTAQVGPQSEGVQVGGTPVGPLIEGAEAAIVFVDPFSFPVRGYVEAADRLLPGIPLMGGLASGADSPGGNRLVLDGEIHDDGGVGVLLGAGAGVRTVVSQGCRPIGPPMIVTAAEANHLRELAGRSAYAKLGEIVSALPPEEQQQATRGLHLGIAIDEYADEHGRGDFLIRTLLGIDPEAGAVAVGEIVEVGRTVQFQVRDAAGAGEDLAALLGDLAAPVSGALLFSCNGRGTTMFPDASHDVRVLRETLGEIPAAGFFAAGEIGPVGGRNHLHGFTASVLTFGP
ncbi:FIST N-terminal domain-containing protein [Pseudonocardia ailaonensis]|uniref:FIST N-terminal domain-containing protein n=1 Tax=Pseudonocardia ailaonensis TaxID=367279 RepID=A0ABN2N1Q3_9PSEU